MIVPGKFRLSGVQIGVLRDIARGKRADARSIAALKARGLVPPSALVAILAMLPPSDDTHTPPGRRRFTQAELDACTCPKDEVALDLGCPTHGENGPTE